MTARVYYEDEHVTLWHGRYQDVVPQLQRVSAVITDPPYSKRTHDGHNYVNHLDYGDRRELSYEHWDRKDIAEFCSLVVPKCDGWVVALSDHMLCIPWQEELSTAGLTSNFPPVGCLITGMTVRLCGDGPSSWMVYANVARPVALAKWGTLPGGYHGPAADRIRIGGKPLWLVQKLVRDYSREGDVILDTCAGAGTLGRAAKDMGRKAILIEQDESSCAEAAKILRPHRSWQQELF